MISELTGSTDFYNNGVLSAIEQTTCIQVFRVSSRASHNPTEI